MVLSKSWKGKHSKFTHYLVSMEKVVRIKLSNHFLASDILLNLILPTLRPSNVLYFDSFGLGVMNYRLFQYFKRYDGNRPIIHSKICIQSLTSYSCGLFVTAFVKHVKSIKSYHLFMGKFNHENLPINDLIVYSLL